MKGQTPDQISTSNTAKNIRSSEESSPSDFQGDAIPRRIYVGGFSDRIKSEDLSSYFSQFGSVEFATVVGELQLKPRGYGFLTFNQQSSLERALDSNSQHIICGEVIKCNYARSSKTQVSKALNLEARIHVSGVDFKTKKSDLRLIFREFGTITKVVLIFRKQTNK